MLKRLYIKNFTLIDTLDINLYEGFSVVTGETGAGKSIVLGAIGLLLGQRADSKALKAGTDKCVIEAHFDLSRYHLQTFFDENDIEYDGDDTIVRRELTAAGKSRAFINDTPVALTMLHKGEGDAVISAGSTGALLSGATLLVRRIRGVRRACFGPVLPNGGKGTLLIDSGANDECTPEYLLQFAYIGSFYSKELPLFKHDIFTLLVLLFH